MYNDQGVFLGLLNEKLPPSHLVNDISLYCHELENNLQITNKRLAELQKSKPHGRVKVVQSVNRYNCIYYEKKGRRKEDSLSKTRWGLHNWFRNTIIFQKYKKH